jgi:N-acyl-D-amino-acid deacylase
MTASVRDPFDVLIHGGRVVDGTGLPWYHADVGIRGDRIATVGRLDGASAAIRIDAHGRIVCPGFIDAHVHGDLIFLLDPEHEPAIRRGVTTTSSARTASPWPRHAGDAGYMCRYTAASAAGPSGTACPKWDCNGRTLTSTCPSSIAAPRSMSARSFPTAICGWELMGPDTRPPTSDELKQMGRMVREGMEQGAVGISTGLDYIPSRYADTEELIALCREMASSGGVYVTHMRRYDPDGLLGSMEEVFRIGREAGVAVHISHFNSRADLALPKLDAGRAEGIDATYDLYCYLAGNTILGMIALPPWVQEGGVEATLARLRDPGTRTGLREWFANPRIPLENVRLGYVANPADRQNEGRTLEDAAQAAGKEVGDFVCDLLLGADLAVGCVVPHRQRGPEDVRAIRHPAMMGGSDGIFVGGHRTHAAGMLRALGHPSASGAWGLEGGAAVERPTRRAYGLGDRGLIRPGMAADVVVFDADVIADRATYEEGRRTAVGVEHVLVNGELVLHHGQRTRALPGRAAPPGMGPHGRPRLPFSTASCDQEPAASGGRRQPWTWADHWRAEARRISISPGWMTSAGGLGRPAEVKRLAVSSRAGVRSSIDGLNGRLPIRPECDSINPSIEIVGTRNAPDG